MDDVQPYKFGGSEPQTPVSLSGMDRLGERMARQIRAMLEPIIGLKPTVATLPAEMVNYDLWSAMAPNFCALSTYKLHPLKGVILVKLDAAMVSGVVERFYGGGAGGRPKHAEERTEFSRSEERILAKLSDEIMHAMVRTWADLLPMDMALVAREYDPQALVIGDANDQLLSQSFTVSLGKEDNWVIELMLPQVALRQLEPLLGNSPTEEIKHKDPLWQARIARQMGDIRLPAKSILARPNLTLDELLNLKNGDVIPVNIARSLPLIVGNRLLAHGTIGEQNGRAAFMIENIAKDQTA